jgi:hypothetical protein
MGALVGNIWARPWFDRLSRTLSRSGHRVDWYGDDHSPYVKFTSQELSSAGIRARGLTSEPELVKMLRTYAFAIVPTGVLEEDVGTTRVLAELSLPGRILFIAATSNTPLIVLGSEGTSAARFVRRFDIGVCSPYRPDAFAAAVEGILRPDAQARLRRNAVRIARTLAADGIHDWVWKSIESGVPADDRFERLLPRDGDEPPLR